MKAEEISELRQIMLRIQEASKEWLAAKAISDQLEEDNKSFLADLMNMLEKSSTEKFSEAKLDRWARGSKEYRTYIVGMVAARADTLKKKVRLDNLERWWETARTEAATDRTKIRMGIFSEGG